MAALISQTDLEAHKVCLQGPLVDAPLPLNPPPPATPSSSKKNGSPKRKESKGLSIQP